MPWVAQFGDASNKNGYANKHLGIHNVGDLRAQWINSSLLVTKAWSWRHGSSTWALHPNFIWPLSTSVECNACETLQRCCRSDTYNQLKQLTASKLVHRMPCVGSLPTPRGCHRCTTAPQPWQGWPSVSKSISSKTRHLLELFGNRSNWSLHSCQRALGGPAEASNERTSKWSLATLSSAAANADRRFCTLHSSNDRSWERLKNG